MNRKLLLTLVAVVLIALAGCAEDNPDASKDIEEVTGQNVSNVKVGGSYQYEVRLTEKNQIGLVKAQPPFEMQESLERQNLIRRYKHLNDRNNEHHVYMMSHDGKVIAYRVAQGKVSSVNSKLTNNRQIVASTHCLKTTHRDDEAGCFKTVESPQMDGSYGTNGAAIFFFTTNGDYVEWNGLYLVSENPMNIQTKVMLVEHVDDESSGNETSTNETS